jgi:hypothetical protein
MEDPRLIKAKARIEAARTAIADVFKEILDGAEGNGWQPELLKYIGTLYGIVHQTATAYSQLWDAAAQANLMYCACNTRNLLELGIWSEYCSIAQENALRFADDAIRDYAGILGAISGLASAWDDQRSLDDVSELLKWHAARSPSHGIAADDRKYLRVSDAARELGPAVEESFKAINTVVSKLVHPTAFVVNNAAYPAWKQTFVDETVKQLFSIGVSIADAIFNRLLGKATAMRSLVVNQAPL